MRKRIFFVIGLFALLVLVVLGFLFFSSSDSSSSIPLTSPTETHEGLNIFQYSADQGVIRGAYIEGSARVDFEGIRVGVRPFFSLLMEPDVGFYDVSACYIAANGDPFIVMDSCSVSPKNIDPDSAVRTKEFELASKAAQEIEQLQFPSNMQRVQEILSNLVSLDDLAATPVSQ